MVNFKGKLAVLSLSAFIVVLLSGLVYSKETLSSDVAEKLGVPQNVGQRFVTIYQREITAADKERPEEEYKRIISQVSYAHGGGDVHIWQVRFADGYNASKHLAHIYLDVDNNMATGRQHKRADGSPADWQGVDDMLTLDNLKDEWNISRSHWDSSGKQSIMGVNLPIFVAEGNVIYCRYDVPMNKEGGEFVFRARVVSQIPGKVVNSTPWLEIKAKDQGEFKGEKISWETERIMNGELQKTFGLDFIRAVETDPKNQFTNGLDCEKSGFRFHKAEYRTYAAVGYTGGTLWTTVKSPGKFYPGFIVYDDRNSQEGYLLKHNNEVIGSIVTNEGDRRQWLIFSPEPIDVKSGDKISIEATGSGRHLVESIVLLKEAPPVKKRVFAIENINWVVNGDSVILGCTTNWSALPELEVDDSHVKVIRNTDTAVNHRFVLENMDPSKAYTIKLKATDPEGGVVTDEVKVEVAGPKGEWTVSKVEVPLTLDVPEESRYQGPWPVAVGIPFPEGQVPDLDRMKVVDSHGQDVVSQFHPLVMWQDGSIRWALVQFLAGDIEDTEYTLIYGSEVETRNYPGMEVTEDEDGIEIKTGDYTLNIPKYGDLLAKVGPWQMDASTSIGGYRYTSRGQRQVSIEEEGPIRTVIRVEGYLKDEDGEDSLKYDVRFYAYRDLPFIEISPVLINTWYDNFVILDDWGLTLKADKKISKVEMCSDEYTSLDVTHVYKDYYKVTEDGQTTYKEGSIQGWLKAEDLGVIVRNFPEKYPKNFNVEGDEIYIGLAAPIQDDWYTDSDFPNDKNFLRSIRRNTDKDWTFEQHALHFYLQEGGHKLRQGMSLGDELLLVLGDGDMTGVAEAFQTPLIARASTEWYLKTQALGDFATSAQQIIPLYETQIRRGIDEYLRDRESKRLYGSLNFGDWWGEREVNWGNNEYDIAYGMFIEYLRSGNPKAYKIAWEMADHYMNVDIQHYATDKFFEGVAWRHAIGHTGDYYSVSPFGGNKGYPRASVDLGHWWLEGLVLKYYLTGDVRAIETAQMVATRYDRETTRVPYDFGNGRVPGWHLIAIMSVYGATLDPYHLNTANLIVERVLERQAPDGQWSRVMVPGHCYCEPQCIGSCGFMKGVLLDGLVAYNHEVPSDEVEEAIVKGSEALVRITWDKSRKKFNYTSCKKMASYGAGFRQAAIVYGGKLSDDKELLNIAYTTLKNGIEGRASGFGKDLGTFVRRTPNYIGVLEQNQDLLELIPDTPVSGKKNMAGILVLIAVMGGIGYFSRYLE